MSSVAMGQQAVPKDKVVLVIHGGAGTILKSKMTPQKEKAYTDALRASLLAGYDILKTGGSSEKAVEAAIHVMEDSPLFNAGKGAVFTHEGTNELDASIMKGKDGTAGAVAGVTTIKNPITAAIAVMERSPHVMMMGHGAERFAREQGITQVEPSYFYTEERWDALQRILKEDSKAVELDHNDKQSGTKPEWKDEKFGTVGCVALDGKGDIAAGTSTGGMTNKKFGRVGDSPVIGAGTYANKQVGISCTGWGEYFIRNVAAYDVAALMEYKALSALEASKEVIRKIGEVGGDGGMIVLDKDGNVALPFNTAGMYRGYITESGEVKVEIYK
ncbi:isoaspartyl peptidase/L-asparaginase family protein [Sphingobacterium tabacisoli]|uniref:Isoaspartyl peptidase/L-asparaginase family protein n=1 Tax=Sphingobacterium tabacisoli TaxID=2044855 RepID=A0ABW5KXI8_9SPHI|nr:isoaspartyl peptidase/L-asparaginase [Sphingobacterium tabacisoli]